MQANPLTHGIVSSTGLQIPQVNFMNYCERNFFLITEANGPLHLNLDCMDAIVTIVTDDPKGRSKCLLLSKETSNVSKALTERNKSYADIALKYYLRTPSLFKHYVPSGDVFATTVTYYDLITILDCSMHHTRNCLLTAMSGWRSRPTTSYLLTDVIHRIHKYYSGVRKCGHLDGLQPFNEAAKRAEHHLERSFQRVQQAGERKREKRKLEKEEDDDFDSNKKEFEGIVRALLTKASTQHKSKKWAMELKQTIASVSKEVNKNLYSKKKMNGFAEEGGD